MVVAAADAAAAAAAAAAAPVKDFKYYKLCCPNELYSKMTTHKS